MTKRKIVTERSREDSPTLNLLASCRLNGQITDMFKVQCSCLQKVITNLINRCAAAVKTDCPKKKK